MIRPRGGGHEGIALPVYRKNATLPKTMCQWSTFFLIAVGISCVVLGLMWGLLWFNPWDREETPALLGQMDLGSWYVSCALVGGNIFLGFTLLVHAAG